MVRPDRAGFDFPATGVFLLFDELTVAEFYTHIDLDIDQHLNGVPFNEARATGGTIPAAIPDRATGRVPARFLRSWGCRCRSGSAPGIGAAPPRGPCGTTYPRHGVMRGNHRLTFAR